jgi:hypothetical protein
MFPFSTHWMVRLSALPLVALESKIRRSGLLPGTGFIVPSRRDGKAHPDHAALPSRAITLLREVFH